MPESLDDLLRNRPATPERPLEGQTILVIEDSRFASEALRLLCIRSGARVRRADSLGAARRHLSSYRPSVVIVDLGLPDGDGLDLIRTLSEARPRIGAILASSGQDGLAEAALAAGADGFLPKPLTSLARFQQAVLGVLPCDLLPARQKVASSQDRITPDRIALRDDLAGVAQILASDADPATLAYVAQFLAGLARSAQDRTLEQAAVELSRACALGPRPPPPRSTPCAPRWTAASPRARPSDGSARRAQRRVAHHQHRPRQVRQRHPLPPLRVEIVRRQPGLERRPQRRPLRVDRGEPGGVAIAALDHQRLPEHPLVAQPKPLRRPPRAQVRGVALPLVAAIPRLERPAPSSAPSPRSRPASAAAPARG